MGNIDTKDHFGEPLPEDAQPSHERLAHAFIDIAREYMAKTHPEISFHPYFLTGIEIFQGDQAEIALRNWDSPKMDEYRDPDLKEDLLEQVKAGRQADNESAERSRVRCSMLGDIQSDLEKALKQVTLLAAEKGGSLLPDTTIEKNVLAGLKERDPEGGWDDLDKKYSQTSHFLFT